MKHKLLVFIVILLCPALVSALDEIGDIKKYLDSEQYDEVISAGQQLLSSGTDPENRGLVQQLMADAYYYQNDIEKSLQAYLDAIESFKNNGNKPLLKVMECNSHAGFCYRELGQYGKALQYYKQALSFAHQLKDSTEVATQYSNLGTVYGKLGDLDKSSSFFKLAYDIDIARKDSSALGFDLRNLAEMYQLTGNYEQAIVNYKQSLKLLKSAAGNHNSYGLRLGSIGKAYLGLKKMDSARYYLKESIKELELLGDRLNTAVQWIRLANLEFESGNTSTATNWANKAEQYLGQLEESQHLIDTYEILSRIYLSTNQSDKSLIYTNKNIALARGQNLLSALPEAYLQKAMAYEQMGNQNQALANYKLYKYMYDSVVNLNVKKSIEELKIRYDVDHVEQANEILRLENEVALAENSRKSAQLRWAIALLIIAILAASSITVTLISRHKLKQELLVKEVNELRVQIKGILEGDSTKLQIQKESLNSNLHTPLSDREFEILSYAISDLTNSEIADKVFVSANTVKFHLKNVYEKLGVGNRKEALKFALNTRNN